MRSSRCSTPTASAQDNLATGSGIPNNGGNPNASIGAPNPNAAYIDYARVRRVHEDDSLLVKYYDAHGQAGAWRLKEGVLAHRGPRL